MAVQNADIAAIFTQMADLLEIQGANPFRVRAYRNAARTVSDLPRPVSDMLTIGEDVRNLPGIGNDLAEKSRKSSEPAGSPSSTSWSKRSRRNCRS